MRVLLDGGPARFRAGPRTVVVEDGGTLVIDAAGSSDADRAAEVVVRHGEKLRIAIAELGEPEDFLASGRAVWLCAVRDGTSGPGNPEPAARRGDQPSG